MRIEMIEKVKYNMDNILNDHPFLKDEFFKLYKRYPEYTEQDLRLLEGVESDAYYWAIKHNRVGV